MLYQIEMQTILGKKKNILLRKIIKANEANSYEWGSCRKDAHINVVIQEWKFWHTEIWNRMWINAVSSNMTWDGRMQTAGPQGRVSHSVLSEKENSNSLWSSCSTWTTVFLLRATALCSSSWVFSHLDYCNSLPLVSHYLFLIFHDQENYYSNKNNQDRSLHWRIKLFPEPRGKNLIPKHSTDTPGLHHMTPTYLHSLSLQY